MFEEDYEDYDEEDEETFAAHNHSLQDSLQFQLATEEEIRSVVHLPFFFVCLHDSRSMRQMPGDLNQRERERIRSAGHTRRGPQGGGGGQARIERTDDTRLRAQSPSSRD